MLRFPRFLQVLGVNSVPVVGVLAADWATGTALALYWCENLMVTLLVGLRIWLHRRATGKRGHLDGSALGSVEARAQGNSSFLASFLTPALVFTGGHAVFLAAILFLILPQNFPDDRGVDLLMLRQGLTVVAIILAVGFVIDVVRIRDRSFYWIRQMAGRVMGRVIIVHLTIIFGMMGIGWFEGPKGLFIVFAGFKLLMDLGTFLGSDDLPDPNTPSKMTGFIRMFAGDKRATAYDEFHRDYVDSERRRAAQWERTS